MFKVRVTIILRIVSKHYIDVRNVLLKHIFNQVSVQVFLGGAKMVDR